MSREELRPSGSLPDHQDTPRAGWPCRNEYVRPGGRQRGDRIVRCHLPAGHPGEHEEANTEITWLWTNEIERPTVADRTPAPVPPAALDADALLELATPLLREAFDEMPPEQAVITALGRRIKAEVRRIHAAGVAAGRTAAAADHLIELISDLADPDPCWFDHHGYCQAHGWMATDPRCPHARAKDVLAAASVGKRDDLPPSVAPTPVPTDAEIAEGMSRDDVEAHRIYSDWARDGSKPVLEAIREAVAAGRTAAAADIAEKLDAMADDEAQRPNRDDRSYVIEGWLREAAGIAALIDEGADRG